MSKQKRRFRKNTPVEPVAELLPPSRMGTRGGAGFVVVAAVLLAGTIWCVYGRAVDTPFIFDDKVSIERNRSIRQLLPLVGNAEHPGPLSPPRHNPVAGRPLVNLTLALNYHFGQLNPSGYHVFNLCVHVLSALLVFAIIRRTLQLPYFGGRFDRAANPLALVVALLWALHPLQTESVIYVTQRTELMVSLCYLATLYGSLRYWAATTRGGRAMWLALAILVSLAGMASKEVMVTVPVVVLLFERTLVAGSFRQAGRQSWPLYAGLAATWGLLVALNYGAPRSDSAGFHLGVPVFAWWLTQAKVFWMYLKLVVWPWPLVIHYGTTHLDSLGTAWPAVLAALLLTIGILILLWRNHPLGFLGACVLLILAPTSLVPITTEVAAERRMYMPLAALAAIVVVGGYWLVQQTARRLRTEEDPAAFRRPMVAAASCVALLLVLIASITSARRLSIYEDPFALWKDTVALQPDDSLAHYNLGIEYADRDQLPEAIRCYQRAVELKPDYANAHFNLANLLARVGQTQQAIDHYHRALSINPDDSDFHFNLGLVLAEAGQTSQAIEHLQRTLQLRPDQADAHVQLGDMLAGAGRVTEAIAHLEQAMALKPADAMIAYSYGNTLLKANRVQEAIEQFRHVLHLDPDHADAHNNLAAALASIEQFDEAIEHGQRVVQLEPDSADAHSNLGVLLLKRGHVQEAIAEFRTTVRLDPDLWRAHGALAGALAEAGQLQQAIEHYQQALRLNPDNLAVYGGLANVYIRTNQTAEAIAVTQRAIDVARAQGQTALADKIEAWLTDYRAGLVDSLDVPSTADETP